MKKELVLKYITPLEPVPVDLEPEGVLKAPVRCLLCDIYGTLFISASGDLNTLEAATFPERGIDKLLARYGVECSPGVLRRNLRAGIQQAHRQALDKGVEFPEVDIVKIWSQILPSMAEAKVRAFAVEYEMCMNPVWPMPGLIQLLGNCRRRGIRLGIISNAQFFTPLLFKWFLDADLHALGFDSQLIFFSYQIGEAKPSPLLFQLAADRLQMSGVAAQEVAFIGNDIRNDIAPSRRVGFQTVLFAGDARSLRLRIDDPGCAHVAADLRITHLNQLGSHLFKI